MSELVSADGGKAGRAVVGVVTACAALPLLSSGVVWSQTVESEVDDKNKGTLRYEVTNAK